MGAGFVWQPGRRSTDYARDTDKGKPGEIRGRKAKDLTPLAVAMTAWLPKDRADAIHQG